MPRENPKGRLASEIAMISEEVDRLETYMKDPQSLQTRVQELITKRVQLLAEFRKASTQKPQVRPQTKKKDP